MTRIEQIKPHARKEELVVRELTDEVLVYDLDRDKAHCLNKTAALIWKLCDGKKTAAEMAALAQEKLNAPISVEIVWHALDQLEKFHLLQNQMNYRARPAWTSRREMVRKLGLAAATLPVIISIVAPTAVQAATCVGQGGQCSITADCCPPLKCKGSPKTCQP